MAKLADFFRRHEWITWFLAKDKEHKDVDVNSPAAVSFCILGGAQAIYGDRTYQYEPVMKKLRETLEHKGVKLSCPSNDDTCIVVDWNNMVAKNKEEIIQLCEEAGV